MSAKVYRFRWYPGLERRDGKRNPPEYVHEWVREFTRCGVCGDGFMSFLALSNHECKMTLREAYARAFGLLADTLDGEIGYTCTYCRGIMPGPNQVCEDCQTPRPA